MRDMGGPRCGVTRLPSTCRGRARGGAFPLVELMVVIGIVSLLTAIIAVDAADF